MKVLDTINSPSDLRRLNGEELDDLAAEVRRFLIDAVSRTGGHLGPNLGVVELTIALHRVFDSPADPIVWDTGHQAYVHKLFTGRTLAFSQLRQEEGLSGYPRRAESEHDLVENSHASTALSYVDGMAKAFQLKGERHRTPVAVVGDGALTGGLSWEALNNIGAGQGRPLVVVVNDNTRSYSPTVGGIASHLSVLRNSSTTGATTASSIFANLGLIYLGPYDGHDIGVLEHALRRARKLANQERRAVVVHCVTVKGRGYPPAEADEADCLHAVGVVDPATGRPAGPSSPTWTSTFGDQILDVAKRRPDVVAITAAMLRPVGLHKFATTFPTRVFDVGMAEQHAVTSAAGLAMAGLHPVVAIYATFVNRAFDQALMDVALHRLPVTFVLDRAGVTGEDGPSHHGMWDLSVLSVLPGMRIAAPRDPSTLRAQLWEAVNDDSGPTALRFPKANVGQDIPAVRRVGGIDVLAEGTSRDVLVVSAGAVAADCVRAAELLAGQRIGVTVIDPRWVLPVNPAVVRFARAHELVVTVEDNLRTGGVGAAVSQALQDDRVSTPVCNVGLEREFLQAGRRRDLLANAGLTGERLAEWIRTEWSARCGAVVGPHPYSVHDSDVEVAV
ncbi:1-deoxy-D-xylulose-5-phosphate synthase [Lentzea flava]|uniref:1-deoxy-D-xylulose-5-phosphate synthase n=1 Tax=Lentzea flava TaxID=103732 RepID=A0ABQ2VHR8_9PSEU|nr:1-deoxy-D-xylulose-5-phosphate synthase [Lentzea flava]MCP2205032.1 1-deoxy-D-xylulose-5-phosphate synthase (EC 2.2.1.7) [Lentzea flava]GGU83071.1 1-deoxy-D-xylulose-5-phosphate synthase 1 [Lentzea flava]